MRAKPPTAGRESESRSSPPRNKIVGGGGLAFPTLKPSNVVGRHRELLEKSGCIQMFRYAWLLTLMIAPKPVPASEPVCVLANTLLQRQETEVADGKQADVVSDEAQAQLEILNNIRERQKEREESRRRQASPSLITVIFSSRWGIASVILLFLLVFSIVYYTLKTHQEAKGG